MGKYKPYLIPFFIFFISFIIRFSLISKGPFHSDSLRLLISAEQSLQEHKIIYLHGHGYPLTAIMGAFFAGLARMLGFQNPQFLLNFMSVLFGALVVFPGYVFLKNFFDEKTAIFTICLLTFSPILLSTSIYGNSHNLSLFLFLLSLCLFGRYLQIPSLKILLGGALIFGLFGASRVQDFMTMVIPVSYLYFVFGPLPQNVRVNGRCGKLLRYVTAAFISVLTVIVFYIPLLLERGQEYFGATFKYNITDSFRYLISPYHMGRSFGYLFNNFNTIGLLACFFGFLYLLIKDYRRCGFIVLWFLIPFMFFGNHAMTAPRWHLLEIVALTILQGYVIARFYSHRVLINRGLALLLLVTLISLWYVSVFPVLAFRHQYALIPDFARWVGQSTEKNAKVIVGDEGAWIRYYGHRDVLEQVKTINYRLEFKEQLDILHQDFDQYKRKLLNLLDQGIPIYITDIGLESNNTDHLFQRFIEDNFQMENIGSAPFEVWNRNSIRHRVIRVRLYKMTPKENP
ncbi:MAG: glycosyltransferase family 39 protein [Candidatus Omnitrophica bacterium]|nr:glycosyltransferase family 39 protein [Candidatus Omnitrophota bacterium]